MSTRRRNRLRSQARRAHAAHAAWLAEHGDAVTDAAAASPFTALFRPEYQLGPGGSGGGVRGDVTLATRAVREGWLLDDEDGADKLVAVAASAIAIARADGAGDRVKLAAVRLGLEVDAAVDRIVERYVGGDCDQAGGADDASSAVQAR